MKAIDPEELLLAYRLGIFPMAESRASKDVLWIRPRERGILPLESFHVPRRLARTVRSDRYSVTVNKAFGEVISGCAEAGPARGDTWINQPIIDVFVALHERGLAHSVEAWEEGELAGGVYGLSVGAAFFAESKFRRRTDASKVALVHLAARLKAGGYLLLDAQFPNPHLTQFGAVAVGERRFEHLLARALAKNADFFQLDRAAGAGARRGTSAAPPGTAGPVGAAGSGRKVGRAPTGAAGRGGGGVAPAEGAGSSVLQVITQTS